MQIPPLAPAPFRMIYMHARIQMVTKYGQMLAADRLDTLHSWESLISKRGKHLVNLTFIAHVMVVASILLFNTNRVDRFHQISII